jgi:plasmid stabilization system protein ParE
MNLRILTSAYNDLAAGRSFYEAQEAGLGDRFSESVFSDIDSLSVSGGIHSKVMGYHRMLTHRYPYAVYYKVESGVNVIVFRVLDCRQNPAKTNRNLGSV